MDKRHKVAIVVDREFAPKLEALSQHLHVWVCASPPNNEAAQSIWASDGEYDLESGVTTFNVLATDTPEQMIIDVLPNIDEHHNEYSHDPPWSIIEVHGTSLTSRLEAAFSRFGVMEFEPSSNGFTCWRCI